MTKYWQGTSFVNPEEKWKPGGTAYAMAGYWRGVKRDPVIIERIRDSSEGGGGPDYGQTEYHVYKCVFCGAFVAEFQGAQCWRASCKVLAELLRKEW